MASIRAWLMGFAIGVLLACLAPAVAAASSRPDSAAVLFKEVEHLIDRHYFRVIPRESLEVDTRRCLDHTLDPHSFVLDAGQAADFGVRLAGRFGGVGAVFAPDSATGAVVVRALYRHSPSHLAGVQVGDTLVAVNGRPLGPGGFDSLSYTVRGPIGTPVELLFGRPGAAARVPCAMRRAQIELPSVRGFRAADSDSAQYLYDVPSRTAYVYIDHFSKTTPAEFDSALAAVARVGARALVLDLRDDLGGVFTSAVAVADALLDSGTIATVHERGRKVRVWSAHPGAFRLPTALLINWNTASASEVLAGALQDQHRVLVVGERSFGKGVGQNLFDLKHSPGQLKLTTLTYERPSGRPVDRHVQGVASELGGIWPDSGLAIPTDKAEYATWRDYVDLTNRRVSLVTAAADTATAPPDRVLERAVQALASHRDR